MTKDDFNKKYIRENVGVYCPTKELKDEFLGLVKRFGCEDVSYWYNEIDKVCYNLNCKMFDVGVHLRGECIVVKFESLQEESMEDLKGLLKVGRVVELRDGCRAFVLDGKLIYSDGWDSLDVFHSDLTCENTEDDDIVRIYDCPVVDGGSWCFGSTREHLLQLVWERKEFEVSEDEKAILRSLKNTFEYIARDKYGDLFVHEHKATKEETDQWDNKGEVGSLVVYSHLFEYINWEDEEPVLISDLLNS